MPDIGPWGRATTGKVTSAARYNPFEEKVSINITEDAEIKEVAKAQPAWLTTSTVIKGDTDEVGAVLGGGVGPALDADNWGIRVCSRAKQRLRSFRALQLLTQPSPTRRSR